MPNPYSNHHWPDEPVVRESYTPQIRPHPLAVWFDELARTALAFVLALALVSLAAAALLANGAVHLPR